jgi:predicted outer membrane protein
VKVGKSGSTLRRAAAVLAGLLIVIFAPPGTALAAPVVPTQLGAADLTLLNGVRQAGLWEMPAGQMAATRGSRSQVRQVGAMIAQEHVKLDQAVVAAANQLGVQLPTQPTSQQQGWLAEMQGASSDQQFDQIFVTRLRAAHGQIFPIIAAVRAGTRNEIVRQLAQEANNVILHHLSMLESTGLVRYGELPPAALPQQDLAAGGSLLQAAQGRAVAGGGFDPTVVWAVLIAAVLAAAALSYRAFRPR